MNEDKRMKAKVGHFKKVALTQKQCMQQAQARHMKSTNSRQGGGWVGELDTFVNS